MRGRPKRSRTALLAAALAAALAASPAALAQDDLEDRVKAAYLFNFARFVTWPPGKFAGEHSPIRICVLASPAFFAALEATVAGKSIEYRQLVPVKVSKVDDMRGCHIGYLDQSNTGHFAALLARLSGAGVLTVHESEGTQPNGVVRFLIEDRRVRFEINIGAAAREELKLSAKLLSVARVVQE